jgi:type I restriction enzyme, S subunit
MAAEWDVVPLNQIYEFASGLSKPRSEFGSGFPFLSFKDVFDNVFVPRELTELVNSTEHERLSRSIRQGDVFLTRTSETMDELGMSCVALDNFPDATFNGFTKRLRPKVSTVIIPEYAGYYFRSPKFRREVTAMSSLSTRASLNNEMLARLTITVPPVDEQAKIGQILKSFDDKISLNRRMNNTLEELARTLYKSWFVDFDPVRAKAAGRDPALPKHLADLFPDSFEDSELAKIPIGWRLTTIGDLSDVVGGSTPSTKEPSYWDGGEHHWATPKDLSSLTVPALLETERSITDAGVTQISSGLLPKGTLLLSSRAPIGYLAIAEVAVAINQGFIAMKPKPGVSNLFLLFWAEFSHETILSRANGSTFLEISKGNFRPIPVTAPTKEVMDAFDERARPLYRRIVENERESRTLAVVRDALLPKLVSGELRISDPSE